MTAPLSHARLLLVRGLTREAGHWGNFLPHLHAQLPDCELLTLDLPGTGAHFRRSPGLSVQSFANAVLQQLDEHPVMPTIVIGMSLGGMVALDMLSRRRQDLIGGVFINTSEASMSGVTERISPKAALGLVGALASPSLRAREALIHRLTSINATRNRQESAPWVDIAKTRPVATKVLLAQLIAAARYRAPASLDQPLLWLASAQDRFVDPSCSRRLQGRFGGELKVYAFAGHDLTLDAPQWAARQIRDFLGAHLAAPSPTQ